MKASAFASEEPAPFSPFIPKGKKGHKVKYSFKVHADLITLDEGFFFLFASDIQHNSDIYTAQKYFGKTLVSLFTYFHILTSGKL